MATTQGWPILTLGGNAAAMNAATGQRVMYNYASSVTASGGNIVYYVYPQQANFGSQYPCQWYEYPTTGGSISTNVVTTDYVPLTPEQQAEANRAAAKWKAEEDAAFAKAEELLFLHLSDKQREQYLRDGYFETEINDRTYRIRKGNARNVRLVENGKEKFSYCALPCDHTPVPDVMLAQLLMLEADEAKFLAVANKTTLY